MKMTLDEAIQHCKEIAIEYEAKAECFECGKEHRQLAEWLEDYKQLKEHFETLPDWIPVWVDCEEAMPADYERVLVLFKDNLHDKTFCGVAFWGRSMKRNGQFTWNFPVLPMQYDARLIPEWAQCEVTHWMPLPSTDGLDGR